MVDLVKVETVSKFFKDTIRKNNFEDRMVKIFKTSDIIKVANSHSFVSYNFSTSNVSNVTDLAKAIIDYF